MGTLLMIQCHARRTALATTWWTLSYVTVFAGLTLTATGRILVIILGMQGATVFVIGWTAVYTLGITLVILAF
jgi:hypothetical protein